MGYDRPMMKHTTKLAAAALALAALGSACQSHTDHDLSTTSTTLSQAESAMPVPIRIEGQSPVMPCPDGPNSCELDYRADGHWYVDNVRVPDVDCSAEDDCWAMWHEDERGWMIHEGDPPPGVDSPYVPEEAHQH